MPRLHHHYRLIGRKSLLLSLALPFSSFLHSQTQEGSSLNAAPTTLPPQRPNVLYVFPDQFRNSAMGFWRDSLYRSHVRWQGDPVHTPRLNAFADEAAVFSQALSNCPVSSAHRGMLLTGLYPNKSGVSLNCNATRPISGLRDALPCRSAVVHPAGYRRA